MLCDCKTTVFILQFHSWTLHSQTAQAYQPRTFVCPLRHMHGMYSANFPPNVDLNKFCKEVWRQNFLFSRQIITVLSSSTALNLCYNVILILASFVSSWAAVSLCLQGFFLCSEFYNPVYKLKTCLFCIVCDLGSQFSTLISVNFTNLNFYLFCLTFFPTHTQTHTRAGFSIAFFIVFKNNLSEVAVPFLFPSSPSFCPLTSFLCGDSVLSPDVLLRRGPHHHSRCLVFCL